MTHRPNAPPHTLIVKEYDFHQYVFSPDLNAGLQYGKSEIVTYERLKIDLLASREMGEKLRQLAHALCDFYETLPDEPQ